MSLTNIDAIPYSTEGTYTISGGLEQSPEAGGAFRSRAFNTVSGTVIVPTSRFAEERFAVVWPLLTAAQYTFFFNLMDAVKYSGAIAWTPPGEGSPRAFRFVKCTDTSRSAAELEFTAELLAMPCVEI